MRTYASKPCCHFQDTEDRVQSQHVPSSYWHYQSGTWSRSRETDRRHLHGYNSTCGSIYTDFARSKRQPNSPDKAVTMLSIDPFLSPSTVMSVLAEPRIIHPKAVSGKTVDIHVSTTALVVSIALRVRDCHAKARGIRRWNGINTYLNGVEIVNQTALTRE